MSLGPEPGKEGEVTLLLRRLQRGDAEAGDRLFPLVYEELRRLAGSFMGREQAGHTLQATVLVNEAFMRLAGQEVPWQSRGHFMAIAAAAMRRVLVDHARARAAQKRGGGMDPVTLQEGLAVSPGGQVDVLALHQALERLSDRDPRQGRVVELRFFGDLSVEEVAEVLEVSAITVKRDWRHARAWLHRELSGAPGPRGGSLT